MRREIGHPQVGWPGLGSCCSPQILSCPFWPVQPLPTRPDQQSYNACSPWTHVGHPPWASRPWALQSSSTKGSFGPDGGLCPSLRTLTPFQTVFRSPPTSCSTCCQAYEFPILCLSCSLGLTEQPRLGSSPGHPPGPGPDLLLLLHGCPEGERQWDCSAPPGNPSLSTALGPCVRGFGGILTF